MKIHRYEVKRMPLVEFADFHGLVMEIHERRVYGKQVSRYWAKFEGAEVKDGGLLAGVFGNGDTEELAMAAYAKRISEKLLVLNACRSDRVEICVPALVEWSE